MITAVTIARNGAAVGAIDLGFATDGVLSINVRGDQDELARPLATRSQTIRGSRRWPSPVATRSSTRPGPWQRRPPEGSAATPTPCTFVSPEFFSILRMPIARGRGFSDDEARTAARVAIVSAATANAFWPGEDPIGKTIRIETPDGRAVDELPGYSQVMVVGMVRDIVTGCW